MTPKIPSFSRQLEASIPRRRRWTEHFITGLLVLAPAYVTILIVRFLLTQINRVLSPAFRWLDPYMTSRWAELLAHLIGIVVVLVGVVLIGWGARILVVRRMFSAMEDRLTRLPLIGKIYAAMREMTQAFTGEHKKTALSRVVLVEWPKSGQYTIGFVTKEDEQEPPAHLMHVLIPTTPTPLSGFLLFVERDAAIPLEMSVEDGLKLAVSAGLVGPMIKVPPRSAR